MVTSVTSNSIEAIRQLNQMPAPDLSTTRALQSFDQGRPSVAPSTPGLGENLDIQA